jgi:hypothetical protein
MIASMSTPTPPLPPRISPAALSELETAFREYTKLVLAADLSWFSKTEYVDRVDQFVRWLKHDFDPGSRTASRRTADDVQISV